MKKFSSNDIFILSSSCKLTKGVNRSLLVDYLRSDVHVISNEYYNLIQLLNRNYVHKIIEQIDENSLGYFFNFIDFMLKNDFGLIINDLHQFPEISTELHDEHIILKDCIIEIDENSFETSRFVNTINQIDKLLCDDLQLRIFSSSSLDFVDNILEIINTVDIFCVEIHCATSGNILQDEWFYLIEKYAMLSNVFIYDSGANKKIDFTKYSSKNAPLLMGNIFYLDSKLDSQSCGIITQENLTFGDVGMYNLLKTYNGCLYKKLTIDKDGNIKNCPFINKKFGKIKDVDLSEIINSKEFQKLWFIKKDDIEICKDCEFRYNCTDCRAFLSDKCNIHSKPLKCSYNPYTNVWDS